MLSARKDNNTIVSVHQPVGVSTIPTLVCSTVAIVWTLNIALQLSDRSVVLILSQCPFRL